MLDMSPNGMMAKTIITMPTERLSAASIRVSTANPEAMSRIPLRRSQARVSESAAGGFRWDEKAGLRRDALSSQVIDAL